MAERREYRTTVIEGSDRRVYVPVPFDPDEVWGKKRRHAIAGTVDGMAVRGDVQQIDEGRAFVLGPAWRRDCGIRPGDSVDVVVTAEGPQRDDLAEGATLGLSHAGSRPPLDMSLRSSVCSPLLPGHEDRHAGHDQDAGQGQDGAGPQRHQAHRGR